MSWLVACSSRSVSDFGSRSDSDWWSCVSWVLTRGVTQPGPARPGPTQSGPRAPGAPAPMRPLPLFSFSHSIYPTQQPPSPSPTSLSLSPRGALGFGDGDRRSLDPRGEFPSPLTRSLSLPLHIPFLLPCVPSPVLVARPPSGPRPRRTPLLGEPLPGGPASRARAPAAAPRPRPRPHASAAAP
jgi:hypothetical protein